MFGLTPWKRRRGGLATAERSERLAGSLSPLARFREEFESMLEDFFGEGQSGTLSRWEPAFWSRWLSHPDLTLRETDSAYVVEAELPGFEPDDIEVKLTGNVLTIRAEHGEESEEEGERHYHAQRFYRSLTVPRGVQVDQIDARYHSGVLEIHLPKTEEARGKRIEVKPS